MGESPTQEKTMSALLQQAIASLNLQPGQSYRTSVNGHPVEVRVLEAEPEEEEISEYADMGMIEPWFTIPDPPPLAIVKPVIGPLPLPDPPIIPEEETGE
jgi:hypothetical protein